MNTPTGAASLQKNTAPFYQRPLATKRDSVLFSR
jgi:hypothetical protein